MCASVKVLEIKRQLVPHFGQKLVIVFDDGHLLEFCSDVKQQPTTVSLSRDAVQLIQYGPGEIRVRDKPAKRPLFCGSGTTPQQLANYWQLLQDMLPISPSSRKSPRRSFFHRDWTILRSSRSLLHDFRQEYCVDS